jgi:hypothetical protein
MVPGPGEYEAKRPKTTSTCRFGSSNKINFVARDSVDKPGPGYYEISSKPKKSYLKKER